MKGKSHQHWTMNILQFKCLPISGIKAQKFCFFLKVTLRQLHVQLCHLPQVSVA